MLLHEWRHCWPKQRSHGGGGGGGEKSCTIARRGCYEWTYLYKNHCNRACPSKGYTKPQKAENYPKPTTSISSMKSDDEEEADTAENSLISIIGSCGISQSELEVSTDDILAEIMLALESSEET